MAISDYSTTPGSNTAISGINIAEGCDPANINNAIRQLMADVANGPVATSLGSVSLPAFTFRGDLNTGMWSPAGDTLAWSTGGFERFRLDSVGNISIGRTTTADATAGVGLNPAGVVAATRSGNIAALFNRLTSDGQLVAFQRNTSSVGSIAVTTTATQYNTSSDYRLKIVIGPLTSSGAFIDALKPCYGTWKLDGSPFVGFLAHEFQEVSPSSVTGAKDETGVSGEPVYQAMQASSSEVMANIVAELQSLRRRVAALEA